MKLREYFKKNGIKQSWFAKQIGVADHTLSKWATGKGRPPQTMWPLIERVTEGQVRAEDLENGNN